MLDQFGIKNVSLSPVNIKLQALFATRKPVYERLANLVLDVRHGSVAELGRRLEAALRVFAAAKQEVEN